VNSVRSQPKRKENTMAVWHDAFDAMNELDRHEQLTVDQQLKLAEIKALIAIGQELSMIHHEGINPEYFARV